MHIAPWAADWDVAYEWYGQVDQGRCSDSPRFTPIETRMSENNRYTTEDESKETQRVDQCVTRTKRACLGESRTSNFWTGSPENCADSAMKFAATYHGKSRWSRKVGAQTRSFPRLPITR